MKTILITGTPGTGKTEFSKLLARKSGFEHINLNDSIKKEKWFDSFDKVNDCAVVDLKKLSVKVKGLISEKKKQGAKGIILDSHLIGFLPKSMVDLCIVLKCDLKELRKRLAKRKYAEKKIMDNLEAEIFRVCEEDANRKGYAILLIDNTKKLKSSSLSLILDRLDDDLLLDSPC